MAQVSYGTITITDVDNGSEAISIAVNANENAAGALSIARSTEQHFWFNPQDIGMGTQLVESGAYITDTPIDIFRKGKNGGYLLARSDGLELGRSTNKFMTLTSNALNFYRPGTPEIDASLSANGLILAKGGIKAGTEGEIGFIYLSTDNYGTTLTINGHEASDWRQVIGPNFGVRANGIMYATGVDITGDINATGGTIGGFEINETSIHTKNISVTSSTDNSIALSSVDFSRIINRVSREGLRLAIGDKFGVTGDGTLYASNVNVSGNINATTGTISSEVTIGGKAQDEYLNSKIYENAGYRYKKDIIIYGESNKYYPVYFNNNQDEYNQNMPHEILITRTYAEQAPADWNTSTHKGGLTLNVKWNYGGWGGATYKAEILAFNEVYSTMVGDVIVGTGSGMLSAVYLRGGGSTGALYHIASDIKIDSTRFDSSFPLIGTTAGATIMQTGTYSWTVASALTTPNAIHINSLIAENTASSYITYINATDGIKIHNSSDTTNYARVNSDGLQVFKNNTQVANFGDTATIGRVDKNHIEISDTLFQMKTRSVDTSAFVHFKDLRDSTGYALIKRTLIYDLDGQGRINRISLSLTPDTSKPYVIKINGTTITDRNVASISGSYVYIYADAYQVDGTEIYVEYYTSDSRAQTFTFGKRTTSEVLDNAPGGWSFSSGSYNLANGTNSFAQGYGNKANGDSSFVTGQGNTAQGNLSAAFGYYTKALSPYSAAFGRNTIARGGLACGYYNNEGFTVGNDFQVGVGSYDEKLNGLAVGYFGIYTTGVSVMQDKLETTSGSLACWKPVLVNGITWLELAIYSSSIRYKESITNVIDESLNPHKLYSLPVRQFKFKEGAVKENDPYSLTRHPLIGFIAEEVEKYYPVACIKREGQVEDWDIRYIVPAMLSLVQEQHKEIEELKSCVKKLQNK